MQAVIVAAGESSRFWPLNGGHKAEIKVLGRPLVYWTVKGLAENNVQEVIVVCKPGSALPTLLGNGQELGITIFYVYQEKSLGTGNALWQARDLIKGPFFVLWPGKVNSRDIVAQMRLKIEQEGAEAVLVGAETTTPWDYGVLQLKEGRGERIVENPAPGQEPSNIKVLGAYYFGDDFFLYYEKLSRHHEADLIDAINWYLKEKKSSIVLLKEDISTLKYPWELFDISDILFRSPYFQPSVDRSARIGANVILEGPVFIGENAIVKANTVIEGPAYIGPNCEIGYSNVLRGPLNIEAGVKTGSFCEIKHSIFQEDTHIHSGYFGDSIIAKNCRFGVGFIAANRRLDREPIPVKVKDKKIDTGLTYLGTVVGSGSHFGIHSGTMPGVFVGAECAIGPGAIVFEHLKDKSRLFAEFRWKESSSK